MKMQVLKISKIYAVLADKSKLLDGG